MAPKVKLVLKKSAGPSTMTSTTIHPSTMPTGNQTPATTTTSSSRAQEIELYGVPLDDHDSEDDYEPWDENMTEEELAAEAERLEAEDHAQNVRDGTTRPPSDKAQGPTAATRPTPAFNCEGCRVAKKKCNKGLPSCTRCSGLGKLCVYRRG